MLFCFALHFLLSSFLLIIPNFYLLIFLSLAARINELVLLIKMCANVIFFFILSGTCWSNFLSVRHIMQEITCQTWLMGNRFVPRVSSNVGGFFVIFTLTKTIWCRRVFDAKLTRIYLSKERLALNSFCVLVSRSFTVCARGGNMFCQN